MKKGEVKDSIINLDNKNKSYRYFVLSSQNGNFFTLKGNGHSVFGHSLVNKISEGVYMFKTNAIYKDVDLMGADSYPDDTLVIYKLTRGNIFMATEDGRERRLADGDILNASGNFKMSKFHSYDKEVELIGVTYYHRAIIEAIESQSLNRSFLEDFYHNDLVINLFAHRGNYKINKLFDELESAISRDNKILIKAKSLELLSESAAFCHDFINIDHKDLSEEKISLFKEIKEFLDGNPDKYYPMEDIANMFFISLSGLKKLFDDVYGASPYVYHLNRRLEKAASLLEESNYKINYIYKKVGFNYHSNFSRAFQKKYKCTPSQYRKSTREKGQND